MEQINSFGDRAGHPQMTGEERLDAFKRVIIMDPRICTMEEVGIRYTKA